MLSNTQLSQIVYGDIEKNVVIDEITKGRKNNITSTEQKRFRK